MFSGFFPFSGSVPPCIRLLGSRWQYKPFSGRYVTDSNVDMLRHVRKGRSGSRTGQQTPRARQTRLCLKPLASRDAHTYMQLDWGELEGIMSEKGADYWRRLCPVKALTEQIPPSAAEGSDYIFP